MDYLITIYIILLASTLGTAVQLKRPRRKGLDDVMFHMSPEDAALTREELAEKIDEGIRSGFPWMLRSPEPLASSVVFGILAKVRVKLSIPPTLLWWFVSPTKYALLSAQPVGKSITTADAASDSGVSRSI